MTKKLRRAMAAELSEICDIKRNYSFTTFQAAFPLYVVFSDLYPGAT